MYMWRPEMFSLFSQVTQSFWKEEEARLKFWTHQLWLQWLFIFHALHIFDLKKKCPGGFIVVNKGPKNIKITKQKERTRSTSGYERVIQSSDQFFSPSILIIRFNLGPKKTVTFFFFLEWKRRCRSSAQVGQVTFPAAHLAARHGQDAVDVPPAQLGVQAQVLQAALLPCSQTWKN